MCTNIDLTWMTCDEFSRQRDNPFMFYNKTAGKKESQIELKFWATQY